MLGNLVLGVAVRAASLPGSRMGFMAGLGGNGPIGRSGSSGFSVRWKSVVTRVGRLVSGENYRFEIFSKCMFSIRCYLIVNKLSIDMFPFLTT